MSGQAGWLGDKRVVICAGAGGVGKTTVSAAIALGLATAGRRVAVVTIDPARRLAEALGLEQLGNQPQRVEVERFKPLGLEVAGELSAMMLDVKRTFDEVIHHLAPDDATREAILVNPVYDHLSRAVAGSQEYSAVAKLFELASDGRYDVIVLDTPPSRSAVSFLDAPQRLTAFLGARAVRGLLRPTGIAARAGGALLAPLRQITGRTLLNDLTTFFVLFAGMLDGLQARAADVGRLLVDPGTAFLIVTSTEQAPLAEAIHFAAELERLRMQRAGVIVNRVQVLYADRPDVAATTSRLAGSLGAGLAARVAQTHAELQVLARRDRASIEDLHARLGDPAPICLPDRDTGLQDAAGLVGMQRELFRAAAASEEGETCSARVGHGSTASA